MRERRPAGGGAPAAARDASKEVKSAARTLDVLEYLATHRHRPVRARDLSEALNAPRSSVYAVLRTLVDRGWVRQDASGMHYSIGIEALAAGTTYLEADPILRIVQPQVTALGRQLDETIHYGRMSESDIVYLASEESRRYQRPFSRLGRRLPAYCNALGKSLLAARLTAGGEAELSAHLPAALTPLTPLTIIDRDELVRDLEATIERGYATDRGENYVGISCVAVPMHFSLPPHDALSCSVPSENMTPDRELEIVNALRRTRQAIEDMAPHNPMAAHRPY